MLRNSYGGDQASMREADVTLQVAEPSRVNNGLAL